MDQEEDARLGFRNGDALRAPLRADQPVEDNAAGLPAAAPPVPVPARLLAAVRALLREAPAAFQSVADACRAIADCYSAISDACRAVAHTFRSFAGDGDQLDLADFLRSVADASHAISNAFRSVADAWARIYPTLVAARAAAVRALAAIDLPVVREAPAAFASAAVNLAGANRRLLAGVVREAPAAFALAAAYGYRGVAADGDLGLAAWARCTLVLAAFLVARTAAVRAAVLVAGHPLATARGLRPRHAVRDVLVVIIALAAALAAVNSLP